MTATEQLQKARHAPGFIAALDQSGGSTPKALSLYGVGENQYSGEAEMFEAIHAMRARIITDRAFDGERVLAAILFEDTMNREVAGVPTAQYLWQEKKIIPILKVDKGLAAEADGVQLMKDMPQLDDLLARAADCGVFGTKMRSQIKDANAGGIDAVVAQQFDFAKRIIAAGLVPIVEPEVDIHSPQKAECEAILKDGIGARLDALADGEMVMLKLTLPEEANLYADFVTHPNCLKVAALSGGYSRDEACARLAQNNGMVASFSRALTEGLHIGQSDDEFSAMLDASVTAIAGASAT